MTTTNNDTRGAQGTPQSDEALFQRAAIALLNHLVAEFDEATRYQYDYVASRDMLIVLASLPECPRHLAGDLDRVLRAVEGGAL